MDPRFRKPFNDSFSESLYESYKRELSRLTGAGFEFRLAETPVFIPPALRERLQSSATAIMQQLMNRDLIDHMKSAIPEKWNVPRMSSLPQFAQVDFAIVEEEDGNPGIRLIELQGFPSLTALEILQCDAWKTILADVPGINSEALSCWFDHDRDSFVELARRAIVGDHEPRHVVMMDIDPPSQKTWPDFAATQKLFGVESVAIVDLIVEGREVYRIREGEKIGVHRIYNRVVFDELIERGIDAPFDWRDPLDVEWAPHPNWYWVWSKATVPHLDHPDVPETRLLSELRTIPDDLDAWVLKPLFSFAGGGVVIDPKPSDIEGVPDRDRSNWCLQRKVNYAPLLVTPSGAGVKVEFRCMFFREGGEMVLAQNLCRLSRGRMLGVNFNKDFDWVGGTVGLWAAD